MTELFSPSRSISLSGLPCWLAHPAVVSGLACRALPGRLVAITVQVPTRAGEFSFSQKTIEIDEADLVGVMREWRADPELALKAWFGFEISPPPKAGAGAKPPAAVFRSEGSLGDIDF